MIEMEEEENKKWLKESDYINLGATDLLNKAVEVRQREKEMQK